MKKLLTLLVIAGWGLFIFSGCSKVKTPDGMPELISFDLVITQEGEPLCEADVYLKGEGIPYTISGKTDSGGKAELKTEGKYPGIPAGKYTVSVKKEDVTPSQYGDTAPMSDSERAKWEKNRASEYRPTHCRVNKKYNDFQTSGLTINAADKGKATLDVGKSVDDLIIPPGSAKKPK